MLGRLHQRNDSGSGWKANPRPEHSLNNKEVTTFMGRQKFNGMAGLPLARRAVRMLKERGIYAQSLLSVEQQQLARLYVIRGLESGGSAGAM